MTTRITPPSSTDVGPPGHASSGHASDGLDLVEPASTGDETFRTDGTVSHSYQGTVGPHPTVLSILGLVALGAVFLHLALPLPPWWPQAAGSVALALNVGLAWWQAGSHRVVLIGDHGIRVLRKARWSRRTRDLVGTMPRMPLGPVGGRWCRLAVAGTDLWVHRRYHHEIDDFDRRFRARFAGRHDLGQAGA